MELDLVERCRAGDPASSIALQAVWGPRALAVAAATGADEVSAADAVAEAFERAWQQLPAQHSTVPFRPWFLGLVARTALGARSTTDPDIVALVAGKRDSDKAAQRILSRAPAWLPVWRAGPPGNAMAAVHAVRAEMPARAHEIYSTFRDPSRVPVWMPGARVRGRGPLEPGSRFSARFGASRARVLLVAMEADRRIAFTLAVQARRFTAPLELRFALDIEAGEETSSVTYSLRGIAAPPSGLRRAARSAADIALEAPKLMEFSLGRLDAVLRRADDGPPATIAPR